MSKTVLYLCPSFPYPADNGGKAVFINHLLFLKNNNFKIHAVFLDVDSNSQNIDKADIEDKGFESFKIFTRKMPRIKSLSSIFKFLYYFIFNKPARAFISRYNPDLQNFVFNLIMGFRYDYILFDHFTSWAFINNFETLKSCNSIYIAHNFETKVVKDQYKSKTNLFSRLFYYIEYCKTK